MLIKDDSPLRRLPTNLSPKQAQFCDAVRFTAEMADFAYQQLSGSLLSLAPNAQIVRLSAAAPFLFAWSIIDSAHRLHGLVKNFPSLAQKNQSPEFRNFVAKAESVDVLRNAVQHMHGTIHASAEAGNAAWGTLTWVVPTTQGTIYTCLLVSGAMMPGGKYTPINPAGLTIRAPLDHVTLTADDEAVNLTDVMDALARLVGALENGLTEAFKTFPDRAGSDLLLVFAGQPGPNNTWVMSAQDSPQQTTPSQE